MHLPFCAAKAVTAEKFQVMVEHKKVMRFFAAHGEFAVDGALQATNMSDGKEFNVLLYLPDTDAFQAFKT